MTLPYYKRYPNDFLSGTMGMSLELKGAYAIILDLIYARDGGLPDDARFLAGVLGCSVRKWKSLRDDLVSRGKLVVENEIISNSRATFELETRRRFQDQQRENRSASNKNKAQQKPPSHLAEQNRTEQIEDSRVDAREIVSPPEAEERERIAAACLKAANGSANVASPGIISLEPIIRWLRPASGEACTIEDITAGIADAVATLKARGEMLGTWQYCEKSVMRRRDRRLSPLPAVELAHERPRDPQRPNASGYRPGTRSIAREAGAFVERLNALADLDADPQGPGASEGGGIRRAAVG